MAVELNNQDPIDENDPTVRPWLNNLQGNILRGHGRDHGVHLFFSLSGDVALARRIVKHLATRYVRSALAQYQATVAYRQSKQDGPVFANLFLTANGYRRLGLSVSDGFQEPPEVIPHGHDPVSTFGSGMRETAEHDLGDPPVHRWDAGYQQAIDGMILLAGDREKDLLNIAHTVAARIRADHTIRAIEVGQALRNDKGEGIDHFGYLDGLSQPRYLTEDFSFDEKGRRIQTKKGELISEWDSFEPLARVLVRDPYGTTDDCFGSFLVFRKLEQDVRGFRRREEELTRELGFTETARERAAAMIVGRFRDGTPLSLSAAEGWSPQGDNNFTYDSDPRGRRCPFHAHIRKVNPRGEAEGLDLDRQRRITRRSITYGSLKSPAALQPAAALPAQGVGLLFMCFQAGIRRQFAFIQRRWVNDVDFKWATAGIDPLAGQSPVAPVAPQDWSSQWGPSPEFRSGFGGYVRMKGGEFFFAPSIPFFDTL